MIELISQGAASKAIRAVPRKDGMNTLRDDGMQKVKSGITTIHEVYRVTA